MELALSLGNRGGGVVVENNSVGFCMGLTSSSSNKSTAEKEDENMKDDDHHHEERRDNVGSSSSSDPSPLQLDLLPFSPLPRSTQPPPPLRFPWLTDNCKISYFLPFSFHQFPLFLYQIYQNSAYINDIFFCTFSK